MPSDRSIQEFPGLGTRLTHWMRQKRTPDGTRYTQLTLAELADLSRQTVSVAINSNRATRASVASMARALGVPLTALIPESPGQWEPDETTEPPAPEHSENSAEFEEWVSNLDRIVVTLRNYPGGEIGQKLKIGFLNAVEDIARETGNKLPMEYYALRKRVQDGEQI